MADVHRADHRGEGKGLAVLGGIEEAVDDVFQSSLRDREGADLSACRVHLEISILDPNPSFQEE